MRQSLLSRLEFRSGRGHGPRSLLDQNQITGLATVFIGMSQLPLAFVFANHWASLFVVGSGGWLLIGIGVNVFRGREPFEVGWSRSRQVDWLNTVLLAIHAIAVVIAASFVAG